MIVGCIILNAVAGKFSLYSLNNSSSCTEIFKVAEFHWKNIHIEYKWGLVEIGPTFMAHAVANQGFEDEFLVTNPSSPDSL